MVPTRTVAIVSDIVEVRGGRAMIPVDIPDFNGTLRLMAVAWSENSLGSDVEQIVVRDPVVAELILPRFLAPRDEAQGALNIDNVEGPNGAYTVTVSGSSSRKSSAAAPLPAHARRAADGVDPDHRRTAGVGQNTLRLEGRKVSRRGTELRHPVARAVPAHHDHAHGAAGCWRLVACARRCLGWLPVERAGADLVLEPRGDRSGAAAGFALSLPVRLHRAADFGGDAAALLQHARVGGGPRNRSAHFARRVQEAATQLLDRQGPDGAFGL